LTLGRSFDVLVGARFAAIAAQVLQGGFVESGPLSIIGTPYVAAGILPRPVVSRTFMVSVSFSWKNAAGTLFGLSAINTAASTVWVRVHETATDHFSPKGVLQVEPGEQRSLNIGAHGVRFDSGIFTTVWDAPAGGAIGPPGVHLTLQYL
jgi:hypothetical protein